MTGVGAEGAVASWKKPRALTMTDAGEEEAEGAEASQGSRHAVKYAARGTPRGKENLKVYLHGHRGRPPSQARWLVPSP